MAGANTTWWAVAALVMTSCIVDDDRCGPGERVFHGLFEGCVCQSGYVPNADGVGCHACGPNEETKGNACVCSEGYGRTTASAPCVLGGGTDPDSDAGEGSAAVSGEDMPCASSADCAGTQATYCLTLKPPPVCLVQGCASGAARCGAERECCEIDVLPELAATSGLCVPKGACTAPGMVVNP